MASYRLRSTHIIHLRQTVTLLVVIGIVSAMPGITQARPLITYLTGDTPADGQVVFRVVFNSAVADSAKLTIVASESDTDLRLDNIDFVPGSGFSEVIVTAQSTSTANGALDQLQRPNRAELPDVIGSTNAVADWRRLGLRRGQRRSFRIRQALTITTRKTNSVLLVRNIG